MSGKSLIGVFCAAVLLSGFASETRVADAAQQGDQNALRSLLAKKADVNAAQGDGMTALHWAASRDDLEMARVLIAAGANAKATTRLNAVTPLMMACKNGNAAMIEALLKAGAEANATEEDGTTPLMLASASGSADAVKDLLDHGAEVNAKEGAHGQTALMFAASLNRDAAIRVLMEHHADSSVTTRVTHVDCNPCATFDADGNPIPEGGRGGRGRADASDGNAASDGNPASGGRSGRGRSGAPAAESDSAKPAGAAAPRNSADPNGLNAFAGAIGLQGAVYKAGGSSSETKDIQAVVDKLVAKVDEMEKRLPPPPPDPNAPPRFERAKATVMGGMTALLYAAREGHLEAARALLDMGADINEISAADKTSPLVMAIMNGHLDLAHFLVVYGADPNLANDQGLSPLYATIDVHWAPKGWFPAPITGQEKVTYLDLMTALLDDGANPNARVGKKLWFRAFGDHTWVDPGGGTAFLRAAVAVDVPAMKLLVAHGADPNIATTGGDTPLMVASGVGWAANFSINAPDAWLEAAKYCVQLGADVNAVDSRGYTALHGAAYLGNHNLIQYLIDKGADVKAVAKDKNTVADMANGPTRFGIPHPDTVAMLEKLGSANSNNCRSDQCLVAPKEEKKARPTPQ
jgi:ankyrin repeat protein